MLDALSNFFSTLQSLFINIPVDNLFGWLYVVLNLIIQVIAAPFGSSGGGFPSTF